MHQVNVTRKIIFLSLTKGPLRQQEKNLLPPLHGLLFLISSKGSFICTILQMAHTSLCYTSCGVLCGMRNIHLHKPICHDRFPHSFFTVSFPNKQDLKRKEGNVLFNDALNTFYLQLYGVRHMVKDHSDSERKPAAAT